MISERLKELRVVMKEHKVDAYLLFSTDPHQNEYLPQYWNRTLFLSGFTGDFCNIAVTHDEAMLWTDSRFDITVKKELKKTPYNHDIKQGSRAVLGQEIDWLLERIPKNGILGIDPQIITEPQLESLKAKFKSNGIKVFYTEKNLVDLIWKGRPTLPQTPVIFRDKKYEPVSAVEKIKLLQKAMRQKGADVCIVSNLEFIARLLNVRGNDIQNNPLVISYLIVTMDHVLWFVNKKRIKDIEHITANITVFEYEEFAEQLKEITELRNVLVDPNECSQWVMNNIAASAKIIKDSSPLAAFIGIKTKAEIKHMLNACIKDSLSMINTIYWVKNNVYKKRITELDVSKKILEFKKQQKDFVGLSFENTIAYGKNAAIVHYSPTEKDNATIQNKGMLLIDSGGNYLDGTSDITRTISVGPVTKEMKKDYTTVLKGHLSLGHARFPKGTRGYHLDALARRPLWDSGVNYYHGTGHGVGYCTCVHETSGVGIGALKGIILDEGMTLTNEPGYYREGHYGIRIENCMYIAKNTALSKTNGKDPVLEFRDMTMCPYETVLIDRTMLTSEEINWVNGYHREVLKTLTPRIKDKKMLAWLKKACVTI